MKPLRVGSFLIALALLAPAFARADGMLQRLPADGAWARFRMLTVTEDQDGVETKLDGYLTMSSVGVVTENDERCRWIERVHQWDGKEGEYTNVSKWLIPERRLQKGEIPMDHVKRVWVKQWGKEARIDTDSTRYGEMHWYLAGPLQETKKLTEVKKVEYQNGTLTCEDGVVGRTRYDMQDLKFDAMSKIWFHEKAAFGVAAAEVQTIGKLDGSPFGKWNWTLILTDTGQNAKTRLPESN
jgi:hypothetical protein